MGSCPNRAQPFPAGPQGLLHFLTSPLGESPAPRTFGGRGPILDLPCRECSAAGQRGFRSCFHAPRPVGSGQPQPPSNPTSSRDWRAGRRRGRGRGRRAVPRARLLGALRYPRSGLPRPAQPRGGVRRADGRARGREGGRESEREREEGGRPAPRSAPRRRSHGGAPRLRAEDQQVRGGEPGRVSGGGGVGVGGWVWRGPRAWPGAVRGLQPAPRQARRACGCQLGGSLCPQWSPLRRSTPTPRLPAPQQKELARRPRRSRPHPPPPLTAPRVSPPHRRLCTRACTCTLRPQCKVAGFGTRGHPASPRGLGGRPFSRLRERWMTRPALCFMHGPSVQVLGVSHPPKIRFPSSLPPGPDKN